MIVRTGTASQLLITQPDHAALAGRIMRQWTAGGLPDSPRRREILHAIDEHDNGWRELDAEPAVDPASGRILDFIHAPADERRGVWPRGVERLSGEPYAAALVAQHAYYVYGRYRTDPAWLAFFAEMESLRDRHLHTAGHSLDVLLRDYVFVRLGDIASLAFCTAAMEPMTESGYTVRLAGARVVIAPDPFGGSVIPIEVIAAELQVRRFTSTADAQQAIAAAPRTTVTGEVCGEAAT